MTVKKENFCKGRRKKEVNHQPINRARVRK